MKKSLLILMLSTLCYFAFVMVEAYRWINNINHTYVLTRSQIKAALQLTKIAGVVGDNGGILLGDSYYVVPDAEWVTDTFVPALIRYRELNGVDDYRAESNDCDDFARFTVTYAQTLNHRTFPAGCALTIGEFWYIKDNQQEDLSGHCINILFVGSPNKGLKILFFEPQTAEFVHLTDKEISSCVMIKM